MRQTTFPAWIGHCPTASDLLPSSALVGRFRRLACGGGGGLPWHGSVRVPVGDCGKVTPNMVQATSVQVLA